MKMCHRGYNYNQQQALGSFNLIIPMCREYIIFQKSIVQNIYFENEQAERVYEDTYILV